MDEFDRTPQEMPAEGAPEVPVPEVIEVAEVSQVPQVPGVPAPPGAEPPLPGEDIPLPAKPKLVPGFVVLGFLTPWLLAVGIGLLSTLAVNAMQFNDTTGWLLGLIGVALNSIPVLLFFGFMAMWLVGRNKGNIRLMSFGVGGMWSYALAALLALLAFGTCLIGLNQVP